MPTCRDGRAPQRAFALGIVVAGQLLTGCQLYWTKPSARLDAFAPDHRDCVVAAGRPIPNDDRMLVALDLYRACLRSRGWERVTGSKVGVPPGYIRGLENEGPVRPNELPAQPSTAAAPIGGRRGSSTNFGPR
jgi:hypothetical protein